MNISYDFKYENIIPFEEKIKPLSHEKITPSQLTSNKNETFRLSEVNSSYGKEIHYIQPAGQKVLVPISMDSSSKNNIQDGIKNFLREIFLPQGYPYSVSEDYTSYQIWDTTQAFCSTITGILATQAVMKGVGVGNVDATPLAATITWVLKDGTGHIGRIAFAWWKGTSLDADCKKWRLVADVLNDAALCLELALPIFGGYTTFILCLSTVMKAIVGVSGGATRAALIQHQAVRGNLADVAAKDGSQETATNLVASLAAIIILSLCDQFIIWPLFFLFTSLHIFSNYRAVKSVCLQRFNSSRYLTAIIIYLQHRMFVKTSYVNSKEPVFFFQKNVTEQTVCGYKINVGYSIKQLVTSGETSLNDMNNAVNVFKDSKYLLIVNLKTKNIFIVLDKAAASEDILCSYFHAIIYGIALSTCENQPLALSSDVAWHTHQTFQSFRTSMKKMSPSSIEFSQKVQEYVTKECIDFSNGLKKTGWNLNQCLLLSGEWRADWKPTAKEPL